MTMKGWRCWSKKAIGSGDSEAVVWKQPVMEAWKRNHHREQWISPVMGCFLVHGVKFTNSKSILCNIELIGRYIG